MAPNLQPGCVQKRSCRNLGSHTEDTGTWQKRRPKGRKGLNNLPLRRQHQSRGHTTSPHSAAGDLGPRHQAVPQRVGVVVGKLRDVGPRPRASTPRACPGKWHLLPARGHTAASSNSTLLMATAGRHPGVHQWHTAKWILLCSFPNKSKSTTPTRDPMGGSKRLCLRQEGT